MSGAHFFRTCKSKLIYSYRNLEEMMNMTERDKLLKKRPQTWHIHALELHGRFSGQFKSGAT